MKFHRWHLIILPCALVLVLIIVLEGRGNDLPVLGHVGAFELIRHNGRPFSHGDLQGRVWAANFIFTSCSGVCPLTTKNLNGVQSEFEESGDVQFVSVSVDPETDTPEMLREYAQKNNVLRPNWHFLTGERKKIETLMKHDFKLGFAEDMMFHSERVVLVDRRMRIRGYYEGTSREGMGQLRKDLTLLLKE